MNEIDVLSTVCMMYSSRGRDRQCSREQESSPRREREGKRREEKRD
jgi:hypothetical protein